MFRYLANILLTLLFVVSTAHAQDVIGGRDLIWERAAYGNVPGVTHVVIQGWNPAITTTFEDVSPESSAIAIPVAALTTPYCASTDADDDAADTGALTLSVTVVTTAYAEVTETLATDGLTSAPLLTANVLGFNDLRVATAGSTGGNEGVIDCGVGTNTAGSAATAYVTLGVFSATAVPAAGAGDANVARVFQYIVPANHKLVCQNASVGSVFATQASGITAVIDGSTNLGLLRRFWIKNYAQAGLPVNSDELLVFPEKTYLKGKLAGTTGTNTGPASMTMECLKIATSADQKVF